MDDIRQLLGNDTLQEIAGQVGGVNTDEVAAVLNAVLPTVEENMGNEEVTRAAGDRSALTTLLPLLLGGSLGNISQTVSGSTGVSGKKTNSILKLALPILLFALLTNKNNSSSANGSLGLLGSLFGGSSTQQQNSGLGLLGALLGGGAQAQPAQQQSAANTLFSLLGDTQPVQQAQPVQQSGGMNLLGSLLGGGAQAQPVQQQSAANTLFSLLGDTQPVQQAQPVQQNGGMNLLGSLLGGGAQQSAGSSLLNLLMDTGRALPDDDEPAKPAAKKTAPAKKTSSASTGAKKTSTKKK